MFKFLSCFALFLRRGVLGGYNIKTRKNVIDNGRAKIKGKSGMYIGKLFAKMRKAKVTRADEE
jgi:hypothetical protein